MATGTLPLFPLQTVLFPGMLLPLHIFEPRYRKLYAQRAESEPIFGIVLTRLGREVGERPEIHAIGTGATLLKAIRYDDGRVDLVAPGDRRFRALDGHWDGDYLTATVEWLRDERSASKDEDAARLGAPVRNAFTSYIEVLERTTGLRIEPPIIDSDPTTVAYAVCAMMPFGTAASQRLLEAEPSTPLLRELLSMVRREQELLSTTGIGGSAIHHPGRGFWAN